MLGWPDLQGVDLDAAPNRPRNVGAHRRERTAPQTDGKSLRRSRLCRRNPQRALKPIAAGSENAESTTWPPGGASAATSAINCALGAKSKIAAFSEGRSICPVADDNDGLLHQEAQGRLRGGLAVRGADAREDPVVAGAPARQRAIGGDRHPCRRQAAITFDWSGRDGTRSGCRPMVR